MAESIHGHEIMEMILAAETPYSRAALQQAVVNRFGEAARFHTCSAREMTLDELLIFLGRRGKVVEVDGVLETSRGEICNHE